MERPQHDQKMLKFVISRKWGGENTDSQSMHDIWWRRMPRTSVRKKNYRIRDNGME